MHASNAIRFSGATFRITSASAAAASPAKSAIFDSAIPSSHTSVSPSESTHRRCSTCSRNPDHDAFPAGCLSRLNGVFTAGPTTSSRLSRPTRSGSPIRPATRSNMPAFTSSRTLDAISSTVENAGSSNDAFTSISRATLIRSDGSFITSAAERIPATATARARCGSCTTPSRPRTSCRCAFTFRASHHADVPSGRPSSRRTCSTTATGTSPAAGSTPADRNTPATAPATTDAHQNACAPEPTPRHPRSGSTTRSPSPSPDAGTAGTPSARSTPSPQTRTSDLRIHAQQALETKLEIALRELALDRAAAKLAGELKDPNELDPQLPRNALQPRDLALLSAGQPLRTPALQLPVIHVTPLKPFTVDPLRLSDRRVVKHERLGPRPQQHRVILPRVSQTPVDQRRDRRQHADRLPIRLATAVHITEATLPAGRPRAPIPQFAANHSRRLMDFSALCGPYPY